MGYQLYHNYFRPHEAFNDKTPAEGCGIIIEEHNQWKTVIGMHARNSGNIKVALIHSYHEVRFDCHVEIL